MHPDEGVLQALLDGELDAVTVAEARNHIAVCAECRTRLDALRADEELVNRTLGSLDRPAAPIAAAVVAARARRSGPAFRWAAAIILFLLGAGALYALPRSPLRHWIATLGGGRPRQGPVPTRPSGIAIEPGAHFSIVFTAPRASSKVTITLTDAATIEARRLDGTARFTAEIDGLSIEPGSADDDFAIDLPRGAPWVEVLVGDRRIFLKDGAQISTAARPDSLGRYILSLR